MVRSTKHPGVVELRPRLLFGDDKAKLEQAINAIITGHAAVFFCPHEPWDIVGAKYQAWDQVEANTWAVPATATADDVINDAAYPHGWTIYAATKPVDQGESRHGTKDNIGELGELVDSGSIVALLATDPDGSPWIAAVTPGEQG